MSVRTLVLGVAVASSIAAFDSAKAGEAAQSPLCEKPRDATFLWSARRVLARTGDLSLVRTALLHYFDDPGNWGRVLGEAERATRDVRLNDFRSLARGEKTDQMALLRSQLKWNLERREAGEPVRTPRVTGWMTASRADSTNVLPGVPRQAVETTDLILDNVLSAPMDVETVRKVVARMASSPGASPGAFAALYRFHERWGDAFLRLFLSEQPGSALSERAGFVMSLSGDPRRLPLLVDLAVTEGPQRTRESALNGLAEAELTYFAPRLHRLAGAPERWIRFRVAAALLPSGQPWAMRLLVSAIDPSDPAEVLHARRAIDRLGKDRARVLLEEMALDGTATRFAVKRLLEMSPKQSRLRSSEVWKLLEEAVSEEDPLALLAASQLSDPAATRAVRAYLDSR